jgi:SAM-dependent methyltransferase
MATAMLDKTVEQSAGMPGGQSRARGRCRFCGAALTRTFVDLGMSPLCESFVDGAHADEMEAFYPLHTYVCGECFLVQLGEYVTPGDIFSDYAYFSSYSDSWLAHAKRYAEQMIERHGIGRQSRVIEIASNDGYLLRWFVEKGVPVLGIEPAANVAAVAREKGVASVTKFFGRQTAREVAAEHGEADLLLGNNVLAHVPDLNDFVAGMKILLKPSGFITMEFPHLMRLMAENQFDTIYHEHFSYLSLMTVQRVFKHHGLVLFDVEELPTHGGSLRIYARHEEDISRPVTQRVVALRAREEAAGFDRLETYAAFAEQVKETKRKLLEFLIEAKRAGKSVAGYGAPGKGNTLLNYCGIRTDFVDYTVDRNPHKHGKFLPGTRIPIFPPEKIRETRPDYVLILPWNLKDEIMKQTGYIREWGGKWVVPIPQTTVFGDS